MKRECGMLKYISHINNIIGCLKNCRVEEINENASLISVISKGIIIDNIVYVDEIVRRVDERGIFVKNKGYLTMPLYKDKKDTLRSIADSEEEYEELMNKYGDIIEESADSFSMFGELGEGLDYRDSLEMPQLQMERASDEEMEEWDSDFDEEDTPDIEDDEEDEDYYEDDDYEEDINEEEYEEYDEEEWEPEFEDEYDDEEDVSDNSLYANDSINIIKDEENIEDEDFYEEDEEDLEEDEGIYSENEEIEEDSDFYEEDSIEDDEDTEEDSDFYEEDEEEDSDYYEDDYEDEDDEYYEDEDTEEDNLEDSEDEDYYEDDYEDEDDEENDNSEVKSGNSSRNTGHSNERGTVSSYNDKKSLSTDDKIAKVIMGFSNKAVKAPAAIKRGTKKVLDNIIVKDDDYNE